MSETLSERFEKLLREAESRGASDLHLIPGEPPTLRVDGVLERSEGDPLTGAETAEIASAFIASEDLQRVGREIGDVHKTIMVGELAVRICVARASGELAIAARMVPTRVPTVEMLATPRGLVDAISSPSGLIVVSSRTGGGKSTTAFALLDHINATRQTNIHTIEDPVQYRLTPKKSLVQQREVGVDVPDVLSGIRTPILMDPDVIFVSEIRSLEALQAIITAAEMGHLVITVMSADSPESAIQRMVDVFPEDMRDFVRHALARVLRCVSCQRLLPKSVGPGRVAAYGVLLPDEEMKEAIAEGRDVLSRRSPMPDCCLSMRAEVERMAGEGIISEETAKAYLADMKRASMVQLDSQAGLTYNLARGEARYAGSIQPNQFGQSVGPAPSGEDAPAKSRRVRRAGTHRRPRHSASYRHRARRPHIDDLLGSSRLREEHACRSDCKADFVQLRELQRSHVRRA